MTTTNSRSIPERLAELDTRKAELEARLAPISEETMRLATLAEPTAGETERFERQVKAERKLRAELTELRDQELALLREAGGLPGHSASGDGARQDVDVQFMKRADDPWDGVDARSLMRQSPNQLRDRALIAVERSEPLTDDAREKMEPLIRDEADALSIGSRWALATTNPHYRSAFSKILRNPALGPAQFDENERQAYVDASYIERSMNEGTTTSGGYLVPAELDPTINILNSGTINPWRQIARKVQTTSYQWQPITSAGVTAEWTSESSEWSDASPSIARPTIQTYKMDAWVPVTFELFADSKANLNVEVGRLVADAFDRLEASAFATGTGGGQPWGVITRVAAVAGARVAGSSGAAGAADLVAADLYAVDAALSARYSANAAWVAHKSFWHKVRQLATGSGTQTGAFWADMGPGTPPELLGHPVYECSEFDSTIVSGSNDDVALLIAADNYVVVDRVGVTMQVLPVYGSNRRPTGEWGFAFWKRVGADGIETSTIDWARLLRV